jgi:xylulokinase
VFREARKVMLPGDYIAMRLTGKCQTTKQGLSECVLWDYDNHRLCEEALRLAGIDPAMIP